MSERRALPLRGWHFAAAALAFVLAVGVALFTLQRRGAATSVPAAAASAPSSVPAEFTGVQGTRIRFAGVEEARRVLAADDDWMRATGELQRAALMERAPPVSLKDFARWQADAVRPWTDAERQRWLQALAQIAPALNRLSLPWPRQMLLISSTGRESADTPHTRGTAIVLPARMDLQGFKDGELLAHELFHVLSRQAPALSRRVYAELGFEPIAPLQWPVAWGRLRIADQDAPQLQDAMRLKLQGRERWLVPVVVAAKEQPDRARGETLEHLMQTRLLEVQPGRAGGTSSAVLGHGGPVWHTLDEVPEYLDRLGGNTDYVLHPEETAADNFMLLVSGRAAPNPGLLQRVERALREGAAAAGGPAPRESGASSAPGSRS